MKYEEQSYLICISIATFGRSEMLEKVLESINLQTFPKSLVEVVVIIDGDDNQSEQVCEKYSKRLNLKYQSITKSGLSFARNLSAQMATALLIRFQDDDDILDKQLLEKTIRYFSVHKDRNIALLNKTELTKDVQESAIMHFATNRSGHLFKYDDITPNIGLSYDYFWGGRITMYLDLFRDYLFDENLKFGAEDIEMAYRITKKNKNFKVIYQDDLLQYMIRELNFVDLVKRKFKQGQAGRYIFDKYEHRSISVWAYNLMGISFSNNFSSFDEILLIAEKVDRFSKLNGFFSEEIFAEMDKIINLAYYFGFHSLD